MYCTAERGVEFKVAKEDLSQSAVTGPEGLATFESVPTGAIRITELPKEGYDPPAVFCRETAEGAGATGELLPVATDNWGISYEFREGYYLECVWANMPAAGTSTDPGTVVLHSYICPVGTGEYEPLETLTAPAPPSPPG